MKKRKLRKLLLLEAGQRQEAETLLAEARAQLAAGLLREESADQLRMVFERQAHELQQEAQFLSGMLRDHGTEVDFLTGEVRRNLMRLR